VDIEPATIDEVRETAAELRDYATHFAPRDWRYTWDIGDLKEIRYSNDFDRFRTRLVRSVRWALERKRGPWTVGRFRMAAYALRRNKHRPDGILDGGNIITHWEETGEYLQYVQPTVGALIAGWLDAEPENPHAQLVAAEMRRIQDAYAARLAGATSDTPED
jgi:hypothetical protein